MVVSRLVMNRALLARELARLPSYDENSAELLLDPNDHQNVPKAVKLLQAIHLLSQRDHTSVSPADLDTRRVLTLLGDLWMSFLCPCIEPDWTLPQQLTSLSKVAHVLFALWREHGTSYMTGQLYSDIQAMIKSAYFGVAKQQLLDDSQPYYLCLEGSNSLELVFGEVRTATSDSNCDALELRECLQGVTDISAILSEHPEWDRGHRRLSYSGREGVDRVNPGYFKRSGLIVKDVHLLTMWKAGCAEATEALSTAGIMADFDTALAGDVDFLRPSGGDKYPEISSEKDRSMPDTDTAMDSPHTSPTLDRTIPLQIPAEECIDMRLADLLKNPDENGDIETADKTGEDWITYVDSKGQTHQLHKASVLSVIFQANFSPLCIDRLLRVRTYTKNFKKVDLLDEPRDETGMGVGDIALGLVRSQDVVALAFVHVTALEKKGTLVSKTSTTDLLSLDTDVWAQAQVCRLVQTTAEEEGDADQNLQDIGVADERPGSTRRECWVWSGEYVSFLSAKPTARGRTSEATKKALTVRVPGFCLRVANPCTIFVPALSISSSARTTLEARNISQTYLFAPDELTTFIATIFDFDSETCQRIISMLPTYGPSTQFPYQTGASTYHHLIH